MARLAVGQEVNDGGGSKSAVRGKILRVLPDANTALLHMHATSTTRWAFLHDLTPVSPSIAWSPSHFPPSLRCFQVQGCATSNENMLLFLHGLGDTHESLFTLGQAMQLPQTAFASFRAPHTLPFDLGYSWLDPAFDAQGDVIPHDVHDSRRDTSLNAIVQSWGKALQILQEQYNWPPQRIFLMGFGVGGSVALHVASASAQRLGGVISISGALFNSKELPPRATKTPGLILRSTADPAISNATYASTERAMQVTTKCLPYHPIRLSNKDEMEAVMKFFDGTLYLRNLALEAQADVVEL
ncbi:Aste57867_13543 [Aphanomyces stellatus]|uniref:Aste57867_13543 protein n=1 Tax=Aphanomyces stellatus TaxID=120398 RepID=A0A485KYX9_9STRA|nr:hypothetical protein As57867_013493 [Aphanomyces stellatus]VFT90381.1 Aste57867_13543 [Aphanomyces stellatus]